MKELIEKKLFDNHNGAMFYHGFYALMDCNQFLQALEERDRERVCSNCVYLLTKEQNGGFPQGCTNQVAYTICDLADEDTTKFGCNQFQPKEGE